MLKQTLSDSSHYGAEAHIGVFSLDTDKSIGLSICGIYISSTTENDMLYLGELLNRMMMTCIGAKDKMFAICDIESHTFKLDRMCMYTNYFSISKSYITTYTKWESFDNCTEQPYLVFVKKDLTPFLYKVGDKIEDGDSFLGVIPRELCVEPAYFSKLCKDCFGNFPLRLAKSPSVYASN